MTNRSTWKPPSWSRSTVALRCARGRYDARSSSSRRPANASGWRVVVWSHSTIATSPRYATRSSPRTAEADLVISSEMINRQPLPVQTSDPRMAEGFAGRVLQPVGRLAEGLRAILSFTTSSSGLTLGCGMEHAYRKPGAPSRPTSRCEDDFAAAVFKVRGEAGKPVRILKFLSYHYGERTTPREHPRRRRRGRWTVHWKRASTRSSSGSGPTLPRSGSARTSRLRAAPHRRSSSSSAGISSSSLQASARAEGHGIGARGLPDRPTKATTSGTPRSTCCRS